MTASQELIENKISKMTLREKIGQTFQGPLEQVPLDNQDTLHEYFQNYPLGSLFAGQEIIKEGAAPGDTLKQQITACQDASNIPLSIAGDLENGVGGVVSGAAHFPNLMSLGAANSDQLAYEYGMWTAKEATAIGFNWLFAPVGDLNLNWLNPIVGTRALGEDPKKVIPLLRHLIRGYQDHGLSATVKHFPGDGVDFRDQHLTTTINSLSQDQWFKTFGKIYQECFKIDVHSIMAGHIALPWADKAEIENGRPIPATVSHKLLTQLAREEMGFKGVIVSDALIMAGFTSWKTYEERLIDAFNAGIDVMLWPGLEYFDIMERAIEENRVSEQRLNESVHRILDMKYKQNLLEIPCKKPSASETITVNPANFADTLATASISLVRNHKNLLPLDPKTTNSMLLVIATYNKDTALKRLEPFLCTLKDHDIDYEIIVNGNCLDIEKMENEGRRFDALLCFFELCTHGMKNSMRPAGAMAEPIWTIQNTRTMDPIIISLGIPMILNDVPFANTVVNLYSASASDMKALSNAIFGKTEFSGKCPVDTGGDWVNPAMSYMVNNKFETLELT